MKHGAWTEYIYLSTVTLCKVLPLSTVLKGILHFFWKQAHFTAPPELNSWVSPFSNAFSRFSDI